MKKLVLILTTIIVFSSCATVFTGSKKKVIFDGNIEEPVNLNIDGYTISNVKFPFTYKVKGGYSETIVKAEAEGYQPAVVVIAKTFNGIAAINLVNVIGWGIDAATGAMMKPEHKYYEFNFTPKKPLPND